jgi:hypothetical protein
MALYTPVISFNNIPPISITCVGITYAQFLASLGTYVYGIEQMYIASSTISQIQQNIFYNIFDASGKANSRTIPSQIDSYQYQASTLIDTSQQAVDLNQNSTLSFNILPNSLMQLKLFTNIEKISNGFKQGTDAFSEFNKNNGLFFDNYYDYL